MATKTLITAEEFLAIPDDGQRYELIQGELRAVAGAGGEHGNIGAKLLGRLLVHVEDRDLGRVFNADTGYVIRRNPDVVRLADVSFISKERWESIERREGLIEGGPDLTVEVVSPSDSSEDVHEKALLWLSSGVQLLWVVHPRTRTVTGYTPDRQARLLGLEDMLDGGQVVPGFSLPVRYLSE